VLALEKRSIRVSLRPLGVYIYAFGSQSCATRLVFKGSARLGPTKLRFCSKTLFLWAFRSAFGLAPQNATRFSAVKRPKTKPRMASSGTGPRRRPPVTHFGEKRVSSRALHPPSAALGPTFRCGTFLFVALALADSSSARLTTCKPQNTSASYRSITNRHQPPTICSTNKSLLNTKKGFAEHTSPRLFSENSMPNQARLKLDYGADEIAYPPTTKGRSREAYPPTEGRCRRQSLEWWRYAGCGFAAGKRAPRRCAPTKAAQRICRAGAEGVFRRHAKRRQKRRKRPDFDASSFCREA